MKKASMQIGAFLNSKRFTVEIENEKRIKHKWFYYD